MYIHTGDYLFTTNNAIPSQLCPTISTASTEVLPPLLPCYPVFGCRSLRASEQCPEGRGPRAGLCIPDKWERKHLWLTRESHFFTNLYHMPAAINHWLTTCSYKLGISTLSVQSFCWQKSLPMDNSAVSCSCAPASYTQKKVWGQIIPKYVHSQIPDYIIWRTPPSIILGSQYTSNGAPGAPGKGESIPQKEWDAVM